MEKPENKLEVFSPLLLENHIRLITLANCIIGEDKNTKTIFSISAENYQNMVSYKLQTPFIGVISSYDEKAEKLSCSAEQELYEMYANKIMREVALVYKENYLHRYDKFIICDE